MVSLLQHVELTKKKSGRSHSLGLEEQLFLILNYLRCYRTQIELSADYNLAESNVNRTIQKVENALIQSIIFALPKKNQKFSEEDYVIVDVTESQIERPKNKGNFIVVKRRNIY